MRRFGRVTLGDALPDEDLPVVPGLRETPNGGWAIAESLVKLMAAVAQVPGADAAIQIIRALGGIEEAQVVMLRQIGSDVKLIREGPFHSAREHLETAMRRAGKGQEYEHHLERANDLLIDALGQSASVKESSVIKFNLGVVAVIRGDRAEARYRLKQAQRDCRKVSDELARAAKVRVRVNPTGSLPLLASTAVLSGLLDKGGRQATTALKAYLPFATTVAQTHNAIDPSAVIPVPQLNGDSVKGFVLEWRYPLPGR
jgi:hypothetical protein